MFRLNKILFISISLVVITKCKTKDYCSAAYCNNSRQHTLCKFKSEEPASTCLSYERTVLNDKDRRSILDKINSRRNKVASGEIRSLPPAAGMIKLEWSTELEKSAQRWADQCANNGVTDLQDTCRDLVNVAVGQNIATVQGDSPGLTPLALVDVWYMELLKINASVISRYVPSSDKNEPHYDYFTQLVWERSTEVGCGGVKFQERLDNVKYRTIYRLVCNFAPSGNRRNKTVYSCGSPCSGCLSGVCDQEYSALCESTVKDDYTDKDTYDEVNSDVIEKNTTKTIPIITNPILDTITLSTIDMSYDNESLTFHYFPQLSDLKVPKEPITSFIKEVTANDALFNDFIQLLKKKLNNEGLLKDLLQTTVTETTGSSENYYHDESVAAFINRVYSKKEIPTTVKTTPLDYVNSTLLVDLIEAVIFRSNDIMPSTEVYRQDVQTLPIVKPVMVQAELAEVKQNREFTGHYFFPEEDDESSSETTEFYYDNTNVGQSDVELEIEHLKMSSITKDFLDDIFESDTAAESTTTTKTLSPDRMTLYKNGNKVMKKFLDSIKEKSDQ